MKILKEETVDVKEKENLVDGGHKILSCSNCSAMLVDIWLTKPNAINPVTQKRFEWKVQANCPFCNDNSFVSTVYGIYHYGGCGKIKEDSDDDDKPSTIVDFFVLEKGLVKFNVVKANENAKPIKFRG